MKAFLATVLSVIAVGVLLIAYGLLNPRGRSGSRPISPPGRCSRANAFGLTDEARHAAVALPRRMPRRTRRPPRSAIAYPVNDVRAVPAVYETAPRAGTAARLQRTRARCAPRPSRVETRPRAATGKKSAMIIGGTTAAAGGRRPPSFGGKKGRASSAPRIGGGGAGDDLRGPEEVAASWLMADG